MHGSMPHDAPPTSPCLGCAVLCCAALCCAEARVHVAACLAHLVEPLESKSCGVTLHLSALYYRHLQWLLLSLHPPRHVPHSAQAFNQPGALTHPVVPPASLCCLISPCCACCARCACHADHRTKVNYDLIKILEGGIEDSVQAMIAMDQQEQLKELAEAAAA
jgi:hypothetical protein